MEISFEERTYGGMLRVEIDSDVTVKVNFDRRELESLREAVGAQGDFTEELRSLREAVEQARNGMCSEKSEIERHIADANEALESAESRFDDLMSDIENALEALPES